MDDLYFESKNQISNNNDTFEEELLLLNELQGGIIALAKNQNIKLYK